MNDFDPYAYLDEAAKAIALPIPAERRDAVAANLARLHGLAKEVLAFDPSSATTNGDVADE
jgi:hypothetical protein